MGLLGNNHRANFGAKLEWGTVLAMTPGNRSRYGSHCYTRSQQGASTVIAGTAIPAGGYPSNAFFPSQEAGEMSMRSYNSGNLTADLYPSKSMSIDLTGSGDLSAEAALVISMFCDMAGSGTLSASIVGLLNMSVDLEGSGDLAANLSGIGNMLIDLEGSGDLEATIAAFGNMSIDIIVTGAGLSTANVGQAVWTALLQQFNENPDSAAAKLLAAGSAGDPWSTELPASYTGEQAGAILDQIKILIDELHKIQGLNADAPMTVTQTTRSAGDIELDITGDGETSTTVTRQ